MVVLNKIANESISRLCHANYPMTLSPKDDLVIKNKEIHWVYKKKIVEGSRDMRVHNQSHVILFYREGVNFGGFGESIM